MLTTLINQAYIFADLSRTESAKKNLQEALLYVNKNHQKSYLGGIYSALTSISLTEDQIDDALKYAAMSYRAFKEAGNEGYSYVALNKWADVLLHDTQYEMAYEKYQEVLVHSLNIDELVNRMYALKSMVTIDMIYGRFTAARSYLNDLQTLLTSVDNEDVMAEYLALEVQYHLNKQLYDQAKNYLNQLSEQVMTLQNPGKVYSKDLLSVRYFMAVKQWEQAQEAIDEAQHGQQSSAILSLLQTTVLTHTQSDNNFTDKFAELVRQSLGQNNKELSMEVLVQAINYLQSKGLHLKQQQIWLEKLEDMNAPPFPYLKLKAFNQASQGQFQAAQQTIFRLSEEGNEWWQESYRHLGSEE
jgi:tetratricopeptide (TPR) repeat protein